MLDVLELDLRAGRRGRLDRIAGTLEHGGLLLLPGYGFPLREDEKVFFTGTIANGTSKNLSFDPRDGRLGGGRFSAEAASGLAGMMARYADMAEDLVHELVPGYAAALQRTKTSFRPVEARGRDLSPRKDDRRLHVDAFPSQPVQGRRILRVFTNVDPHDHARRWQLGEPFARRFCGRIRWMLPGAAYLFEMLGITKGRRSSHDQAMLQLHDLAKLDLDYQHSAPRTSLDLPSGASWIVFTDAVLHAALAGQFAFEQTFLPPVEAMRDEALSLLRILERLTQRRLV